MKYLVYSILAFYLLLFSIENVMAQEHGIGVSPAKIKIGQNVEWPYTAPILVTNLSSESENFEITFEKDQDTIVSVSPGRFSLDAGAYARVLVTFEESRGTVKGLVKVLSTRTSAEGFTTGMGVKIPFRIEAQSDNTEFLAGAAETFGKFGGFNQLFGAGMILATLFFLWYLSGIARTWIFNSDRR